MKQDFQPFDLLHNALPEFCIVIRSLAFYFLDYCTDNIMILYILHVVLV